ncbi:IPT/TIG domain-containing protein [bacterium]|nr:IPT/TIG domain-containing protein [bacterium]
MADRHRQQALLLLTSVLVVLVAWAVPALAQQRVITSINPATIQQGDTVLLTITGENLPTGTVALEFYPQQIALLDILSASETEVIAQIKVPSLVTPGSYNVLLYNHLGDEVFAEGLLTIASDVITPVFRDYDPKVIAEATEGFALLLTGESITEEAVSHLSMEWKQQDREINRLTTIFSKGGYGQVLCAVTGDIPGGVIKGTIHLDGKPVYLVEITIQTPTALLVGHSPAVLASDEIPYKLQLLGTDLTAGFLQGIEAELSSAEMTVKCAGQVITPESTVELSFNGPLPIGEYKLLVRRLGETIYEGEVAIRSQGESPPVEPDSQPPDVETPPIQPETDTASGGPILTPPAGQLVIDSVAPLVIPAGSSPASLVVNGSGLRATLIERLNLVLRADGAECPLLFLGAGTGSFTCLFGPPEAGWQVGADCRFAITDPQNELAPFMAELQVAGEPAAHLETPVPSGLEREQPAAKPEEPAGRTTDSWQATGATVRSNAGVSSLVVNIEAPAGDWDPALLTGEFNLLPRDGLVQQVFSNLALSGELAFRRTESGAAVGTFNGNFLPGDLLVEFSYNRGQTIAAMLELAAEPPQARLLPPATESLRLDAGSGQLQPEVLRWIVDFSPLVIREPDVITPTFSPAADRAGQGVSVSREGSQLVITQELAAWSGISDWEDGLTIAVETRLELSPDSVLTANIPVRAHTEPYSGLQFEVAQERCLIGPDGFELVLIPNGELPPMLQLSAVETSTSHLLLGLNLDKFRTQASAVLVGDRQAVQLAYKRDKVNLDDITYELLMAELVEAENVEITLAWPELNTTLTARIKFSQQAAEQTALLGELGLDEE